MYIISHSSKLDPHSMPLPMASKLCIRRNETVFDKYSLTSNKMKQFQTKIPPYFAYLLHHK